MAGTAQGPGQGSRVHCCRHSQQRPPPTQMWDAQRGQQVLLLTGPIFSHLLLVQLLFQPPKVAQENLGTVGASTRPA